MDETDPKIEFAMCFAFRRFNYNAHQLGVVEETPSEEDQCFIDRLARLRCA